VTRLRLSGIFNEFVFVHFLKIAVEKEFRKSDIVLYEGNNDETLQTQYKNKRVYWTFGDTLHVCACGLVFGCGDVTVDARRMRVTRTGDELFVECLDSRVIHTLVCRLTEWVGHFNCSPYPDTGCSIIQLKVARCCSG